jgi:hypothetical protein
MAISTTGLGQGKAQYFNLEAAAPFTIGQDAASQLEKIQLARDTEKKAVNAATQKKQLEDQKKIEEVTKYGIYNQVNGARDQIIKNYLNSKNPTGDIDKTIIELNRLKTTEEEIIKPYIQNLIKDPNFVIQDESGNYVSGIEGVKFLMDDLQSSPEATEALKNGTYNQWLQNSILEIDKKGLSYDPNFDLNTEAVKLYDQFSPKVQSDISATIQEMRDNPEYSVEQIVSKRPDSSKEVIQFLQGNGALMDKWVNQSVVRGGLPSYVAKDRATFQPELEKQYYDKISSLILPTSPTTTQLSITKTEEPNQGETPEFASTTTGDVRAVELISDYWGKEKITEDDKKQMTPDKIKEYEEQQKLEQESKIESDKIFASLSRGEENNGKLKETKITTTKKGRDLPAITFPGGVKGVLQSVYTNKEGEGAAVVYQEVRVNEDGVSYTVQVPTTVKLTKEEVQNLEQKYGVDILGNSSKATNPFS